jgi:hypothetical protein
MFHLFFSRESSQIILKTNYKVLIMNCIYKTNKYKMLLMIIFDQIALHKIFYVAFCFMTKEKQNDYVWIIKQLKALYRQKELSDFTIFVTDMKRNKISTIEHFLSLKQLNIFCRWSNWTSFVADLKKDLMNSCRLIFSSINHLLCIWHINNNVLMNCKKRFITKETWDVFFAEWKMIMYAFSKQKYRQLWNKFVDRYNLI